MGLHTIFPRRLVNNILKIAVEAGNRSETDHFRDCENGILGTSKQITGFHNTGAVEIIQRAHIHDGMKNASKMGWTQVTYLSQFFHGKLGCIMVLNIV